MRTYAHFSRLAPAIALLCALFVSVFAASEAVAQQPSRQIALYTSEKSVWQPELEALQLFFEEMGFTFELVTAAQINSGYLTASARPRFKALVMPGGLVGQRSYELTADGVRSMREFIAAGGGYIGICAGAAYAASEFRVALDLPSATGIHAPSDYFSMRYRMLGLFDGVARSPYDWAPFQKGETLEKVELTSSAPLFRQEGSVATQSQMVYFAGPAILLDSNANNSASGVEVWGRVLQPGSVNAAGGSAAGKPSIVKFTFGEGAVVLFSQHPVMQIHSLKEANIVNWSLLQAGIQTALKVPVQPSDRQKIEASLNRTRRRQCERLFRNGT